MYWKNNTGHLIGSFLQFERNDNNDLQLITGEIDQESVIRKRRLLRDSSSVIKTCSKCFTVGFGDSFLKNGKYCRNCAYLNPSRFKLFANPFGSAEDCAAAPVNVVNFNWEAYLEKVGTGCVPMEAFTSFQKYPTLPNLFKIGMVLEGIDPFEQSKFTIFSVIDIYGFRLKLRFEGDQKKSDFWLNANSDFIFPLGFCDRHSRKLEPPYDSEPSFEWAKYIQYKNYTPAPEELFSIPNEDIAKQQTVIDCGFNVGQKLEAVNRQNKEVICVATIIDILNDYLLIHLDGYDSSFDYWTPFYSPSIHPINW